MKHFFAFACLSLSAAWLMPLAAAQEAKKDDAPPAATPATASAPQGEAQANTPAPAADASGLVRLGKEESDAVWIHPQRKLVVVDGEVVLREGFLELFACPRGTKEHESIVGVNSKAYVVHAALLAVGAEPGRPVQFAPEYRAAEGPIIDIHVLWRDANGEKRTAKAQDWVRNTKTQKPMTQDWVFGGSAFFTDEETGKRHYYAEQGDLICVSNFTTAMLDVPIASSATNDQLMFEALTENIPPKGTKVRLVLIPRQKEARSGAAGSEESKKQGTE
jgi:hypothetical protein